MRHAAVDVVRVQDDLVAFPASDIADEAHPAAVVLERGIVQTPCTRQTACSTLLTRRVATRHLDLSSPRQWALAHGPTFAGAKGQTTLAPAKSMSTVRRGTWPRSGAHGVELRCCRCSAAHFRVSTDAAGLTFAKGGSRWQENRPITRPANARGDTSSGTARWKPSLRRAPAPAHSLRPPAGNPCARRGRRRIR